MNILPFVTPARGDILPFTMPTRGERLALHLRGLRRRPAHWRFHLAGLLREFLP